MANALNRRGSLTIWFDPEMARDAAPIRVSAMIPLRIVALPRSGTHGRALRYAGSSARGVLHHHQGHGLRARFTAGDEIDLSPQGFSASRMALTPGASGSFSFRRRLQNIPRTPRTEMKKNPPRSTKGPPGFWQVDLVSPAASGGNSDAKQFRRHPD